MPAWGVVDVVEPAHEACRVGEDCTMSGRIETAGALGGHSGAGTTSSVLGR